MDKQEKLEQLRAYLKNTIIAWEGSPIAQFNKLILEKGSSFTESALSKDINEAKEWKKQRRPKIKQCFYNSQIFLLTCDKGEYYEGYCYSDLIPVHHAWIVIDGKVVDFTLEARDRSLARKKIKSNSLESVYLGVAIPKKKIMENIVKTGIAEPIAHKHYLNMAARFV